MGTARAPVTGESGALRADLDRLVVQGVIPDLAALRIGEEGDRSLMFRAMAILAADWEELKEF